MSGIYQLVETRSDPGGVFGYTDGSSANNLALTLEASANFIINGGNVGIGTIDPKGYKLAVAGNVVAESINVKLQGSWPDYVFKPTYKLPSLKQLKDYIDKNQHLPNMPSEAEIVKDGINLGEMVKVQTKMSEELTLYLLEKDKQITEQGKVLAEQQMTNKSLQEQIDRLSRKVK